MTHSSLDSATIDCVTACANGCVLGDRCPHREAARTAVNFVMQTDWDTLMQIAEDKNKPKEPVESTEAFNPQAFLDNFQIGQ